MLYWKFSPFNCTLLLVVPGASSWDLGLIPATTNRTQSGPILFPKTFKANEERQEKWAPEFPLFPARHWRTEWLGYLLSVTEVCCSNRSRTYVFIFPGSCFKQRLSFLLWNLILSEMLYSRFRMIKPEYLNTHFSNLLYFDKLKRNCLLIFCF